MSLILFRVLLTLWSFALHPIRMEDTDEVLFVPVYHEVIQDLRLFALRP
jgi:hypothetical protein